MAEPVQLPLLLPILLPLLLPLLLQVEAEHRQFQLTGSDQAFTGSPLKTVPVGGGVLCALHCARHEGCVALQVTDLSCLLLSEEPGDPQLTAAAGSRIFVDRSRPSSVRVPQECPSTWTRVGNACYIVTQPGNLRAFWTADSEYCTSTYGAAATLPTFETEEQFMFLVENIPDYTWTNIRYVDGGFKMLGGSTSTFWETKWAAGEPDNTDDGFAYFNGRFNGKLKSTALDVSAMPREDVVCMLYAGEQ